MAKLSRSAFISLLGGTGVFLLTGCGSGTKKNSNYNGAYRAAYTIPSLGETGYFNFTVDVKGQLQGSFDNQSGKIREFTGELKNNGEFNGTTIDRASGTTGYVSGKMASEAGTSGGDGGLISVTGGNFSLVENNRTAPGDFQVGGTPTPAPTPTPVVANTFANAYRGTYYLPERNESGAVSFTVDSTGQMFGFFSQNANQPVGLLQGTVSNTGNFTGTLTFNTVTAAKYQQRTLTGTITTPSADSTVADFIQSSATDNGGTERLPGNMVLKISATEPNTEFRGSFSSSSAVGSTFTLTAGGTPPSNLPAEGQFSITVDKQGSAIGTVVGRDASAVWRVNITDDGRLSGTIAGYPATGKVSLQQVPFRRDIATGEVLSSEGMFGTVEIIANGSSYFAVFFGGGGFQSGT